ncbi:hypothetical protein LAZ67_3001651, partial [Cordylochernes scorpioides]
MATPRSNTSEDEGIRQAALSSSAPAASQLPEGPAQPREVDHLRGRATEVQVIRATRADIADARARQRSSTEDNCVFVEHCPDFGSTHYLQAVEELVGGAGNVLQVMKMDGHMLVGLSTKALAERLIKDGLDIGHTHLRAFPFKKRAERITVGNLPFFVDDAAVIEALKPYGDVTSIVPIRLRAGRYTFTDGRREAFILLKEGIALEKIPTRVVIRNKGNVLSAFISYGVKCSRCGRQGHRRATCPINPGRASNNGQPQSAPLPPGASSTVSRQQNRPTPAAPALKMEETPSAPPPVTPAPPLQAPEGPVGPRPAGSQHPEPPPARPDLVAPRNPLPAQKTLGPAAPTPDVEMSIGDALAGLIGQILDLRPGAATNLYKVLGQVKAELRTTPAAVPTPPLPAPRPAEPAPPAPHGEKTTPDMATPPPLLSPRFIDERWREAHDIIDDLGREPYSEHLSELKLSEGDITDNIICPEDREPLLRRLSTRRKNILAEIISAAIERARDIHPFAHVLPLAGGENGGAKTSVAARSACVCVCGTGHDNPATVFYCKYTTCLHSAVRPRVARAPEFFASGGRKVSRMATNMVWAESPSKAEEKPVRLGSKAQPSAEITAKNVLQTNSSMNSKENHNYVNPPAGSQDANSAAPVDLAAIPTSNAAAQVRRNWADITEEVNPGAEEGFTLVQGRKRRRGSANSPTAAAPSSNAGGSRTIRRPQPSAGSVPRAQEIRVTRTHIAEARARQASSSEEHCVYIEHSPELEPFHYLRALDRMLGGTAGVIQITKVNGHQLLGLTNRGLAERLISEGLEVEGTLLRAFPFRKRAERITVGNLPFFIGDSAVINALSPYGRVTSIAPKQMKAGPYVYVDGRRDVFITLHEGITIERIPTRLDINIKGEAWPAYLSSGIRCSRCHGQGHRRAICPLLAGLANNTRMAPPTTPAGVPPPTTPAPPQRSAAQPPAPTPSNPAMEVCSAPPVARAALHSSAPRPSPPAAPAFPMEETPPAPPPVTPAPFLQTPGSREPAAPTPDVEMSIVETFVSSTSSAKNATRVDLDAFIEGHPSVSFAKTDALGLGWEEVLDLLSSRTKAQRKGPLLSPPQCDALAGLIGQILDLRPGAASNLYNVLGQVRAELRTTPAVPPTPPLPAPRPAETAPPAPQGEESAPAEVAYPPPLPVKMTDEARERWLLDLFKELNYRTFLIPLLGWTRPEQIIRAALHSGEERNDILGAHPNQRSILANFLGSVIERARGDDQSALDQLSDFRHANFAAACIADVTPSTSGALAAATNWAEQMEAAESGENGYTEVKNKRRRRDSPGRPDEQRSTGIATSGRTGANPRSRPPAGKATEVQVIRATRADIDDARARQRSSTEDNCVFVEHCPDFGSTHYLQAVEELVGGAGNVLQVMKMDGHMLVGLSTKALAERIIRDGLDIGHTHLRAFPFKKRAERITVGNLPFFVDDAAVIEALKPYGNVTSIVPIRLRAGRYTFTDGRREALILLKEGIALEKIPTRVAIRNKGNVLPAFISYGVKCSRCGRQGHRRANCPINPRRASNNGQPQPATHPPGASSTVSRQPNPSTLAAPALQMEETPSAPPPVIPAPSLRAPEGPVGPRSANPQHPEPPPARPDFVAPRNPLPAQKTLGPAAPTPDVEMSIVEETSASSTSSANNATRFDLDAFIERHPTVSFARTDALGLGREEVLDLSSRTKVQRNGPLLSPPQCDALAGLIRQILDLRPGTASNLYKVLGQVKAELRTTPAAVPPTPPLPAPRPAEPMLPTTHREELTPPLMTPPPPAPTDMEEDDPMTEKERDTPPAPRTAEPTSPALHKSTHVYLGQVKAELRTTPAVPPTSPLPAPRPSGPTPPTFHSEELMPAVMTPPPPALEDNPALTQWKMLQSLYHIFMKEPDLGPTSKS